MSAWKKTMAFEKQKQSLIFWWTVNHGPQPAVFLFSFLCYFPLRITFFFSFKNVPERENFSNIRMLPGMAARCLILYFIHICLHSNFCLLILPSCIFSSTLFFVSLILFLKDEMHFKEYRSLKVPFLASKLVLKASVISKKQTNKNRVKPSDCSWKEYWTTDIISVRN